MEGARNPTSPLPSRNPCQSALRAHLTEFFSNTSVHGLRYLTEPRRPRHERVLWLLGFVLSLGTCLTLIGQTWYRWKESPVIVAMDETQRPIWDIPFPAVTVCPETKIRRSLFDYSKFMKEILRTSTWGRLSRNNFTQEDTMEDVINDFIFGGQRIFITQPILTDDGLCFSFNMLPADKLFSNNTFHSSRNYLDVDEPMSWTISGGYSGHTEDDAYPFRALSSGQPMGLTMLLRTPGKDLEYFCSMLNEGYKVQLHSPAEFPRPQHQSFRVPLMSIVEVAVTPSEIITDEKLRSKYSVDERQCYFEHERHLRFFKQYTQQNCEMECLANITLEFCKCVLFYMPREMDTPICGFEGKKCAKEAARELQIKEAELKTSEEFTSLEIGENENKCNCLQSCTHIRYLREKSQSGLELKKILEVSLLLKPLEQDYFSQVSIYFKESYFIPTRRMELYGVIDFLANCGGLLGLCLGMSVLSVVEVFYWLMVRPCCGIRRLAVKKITHIV